MKKIFDSVVVAAVYSGNTDMIPSDRRDLIEDYEMLSARVVSDSLRSPLKAGTIEHAMREHFGSFFDYDMAAATYNETKDIESKHPPQKRIDVLRCLARQYIRPVELDYDL